METMKKYWILILALTMMIIGLLIHFKQGNLLSSGDYCMNYFAAGDFAVGIFAAGKFSIGIFSVGIFSIGIFSIGIFNIGLLTIGIFAFGWKKKLPSLFKPLIPAEAEDNLPK